METGLEPPGFSHGEIQLIGRLFDEIVADPDLGAQGAAWLGRLQPAVLRLAATDPDLLQSHRHPAWTLVNQLATLLGEDAAARPPNLDTWLERATASLRAQPTRERFEAINRKLAQWRTEQARRRLTEARPALDLLHRHAALEAGAQAARQRLQRRLDASRADEVVRHFVSSVWALVCARHEAGAAALRTGSPDPWDVASDLLWSASPARSQLDAPTLLTMIPTLVEHLRQGMDELGLDPAVRDAWLERLAPLHLQALQRACEDARTDMPLTIDLALEDELPAPQAWAGTAPQPEPVASSLDSPASPDSPASGSLLDTLEIGDRLALQIRGAWVDGQLVWRSDNGHFLLLARAGGGTLSISRRSLDRLVGEGLVRLPEAASALARATRRLAAGRA